MELELRRLEDLAESIVNDFAYMRAREEEMRDTNGMLERTLSPSPHIPPSTFSSPPLRVHQLSSALLQRVLHVLPPLPGCMADILP